ncbi:MAG: type II toxin-antitoxin system VapC family toxin [Spirochaetaceae bacterium]
MILLDTNVLSELMRPQPNEAVVGWVDSLQKGKVGVTSISVGEILYGIESLAKGKRKHGLLEAASAMFDEDFAGRVYPFDGPAAIEYAHILNTREKIGRPISMPDAQIASICRVIGSALATRNIKDFENTGIELIDPWDATRPALS